MIYSDSQIMMLQVTRAYEAKDMLLQKYMAKVNDMMKKLDSYEVRHVPREENVRGDCLSKLANTKPKGNNKSLIYETLKASSIAEAILTLTIEESPS